MGWLEDNILTPNRTFIIAEIGVNHNGSVELAKELVTLAKEAGADAAKFQTYDVETLVAKNSPMVEYQKSNYTDKLSYYNMLKQYQLSNDAFTEIADHCHNQGIVFFSKGYKEQLDFLDELGTPLHKIDSASIIYHSLIHEVARRGKTILLSTGMAEMHEIHQAVDIIKSYDCPVVVLHCVSSYPAPFETINLRALTHLQKSLHLPVGLSDHSVDNVCAIAAVALGAVVIEKHFTMDRNMEGPDHKVSITPTELSSLVKDLHELELALGVPAKIVSDNEKRNKQIMRRSWHYARDLKKGAYLGEDDILFIRPNDGLPESAAGHLLGAELREDVTCGAPLSYSHFLGNSCA